jgi:hypothetical protein
VSRMKAMRRACTYKSAAMATRWASRTGNCESVVLFVCFCRPFASTTYERRIGPCSTARSQCINKACCMHHINEVCRACGTIKARMSLSHRAPTFAGLVLLLDIQLPPPVHPAPSTHRILPAPSSPLLPPPSISITTTPSCINHHRLYCTASWFKNGATARWARRFGPACCTNAAPKRHSWT